MNLAKWAAVHNISDEAFAALKQSLGLDGTQRDSRMEGLPVSEAGATNHIRIEAAEAGVLLWRNNVGALQDDRGNWVRYGLANDSKAINERIKSSDLVGIRPNGQFIAREVKAPGWRYTGTDREQAQLRFINLVNEKGGDACFATGKGTI